jgi:hypothetical protein
MRQISKIFSVALIFLFLGIYFAFTSSSNPPTGFTGAPGEGNCASCHGGIAVNSGPATRSLLIDGSAPVSYVPGRTYSMSVTVNRATRVKFGFSLKVEDAQGNDAGTLISTTNRTVISSGYLGQTSSGNLATTSGTITWNFQWTAPSAGTGPVTIYCSSNAANNNGSTSGDEIYTDSYTLTESTPTYTVSGLLQYDNTASTPVVSSTVRLLGAGGVVLQNSTTNSAGQYSFSNVASGSYTISAVSSRPWGGVTSADALLVTRQFNNLSNFSGLRLVAADVNGSNSLSSADALLVSRRVSGLITSFAAGDWKFESIPITLASSNVTQNIRGICVGDVNASFQPPTARPNSVSLIQDFEQEIPKEGGWVPLALNLSRAESTVRLGSVTLDLLAPSGWRIEGIRSGLVGMNPQYNLDGNRLRLSWFDLEGEKLTTGKTILYLRVHPEEFHEHGSSHDQWVLQGIAEFTDHEANTLEFVSVVMPRLKGGDAGSTWQIYSSLSLDRIPRVRVCGTGKLNLIFKDILGRNLGNVAIQHDALGPGLSEHILPYGTAVVVGQGDDLKAPLVVKTVF